MELVAVSRGSYGVDSQTIVFHETRSNPGSRSRFSSSSVGSEVIRQYSRETSRESKKSHVATVTLIRSNVKKKSRKKKSQDNPGISVVDVQSVIASIAAEQPEIPEEQKNFVTLEAAREDDEKFKIWRQQTFDWLRDEAAKLEALLLQYNSFDLIGNLTLTQLFINPDKDTVAGHHGLPAIVEYATLLYLKHPFNVGSMLPIGQVPLEEIDKTARAIHLTTSLYYGSDRRSALVGAERDTLDSLRYRAMTHELSVRSPGYEHHQRETLAGLFEPSGEWMV